MKDKYFNFYWIFILLLQIYLIVEKSNSFFENDKFYLWNIVVIICSIIFLYNRIKLKKVLINPEKIIVLMIVINGISTTIVEFINGTEIFKIVITILIVLVSIYVGNSIKKNKNIEV